MKKQKRKLVIVLISCLALMLGFVSPMPVANAVDSLTDAKDTISDSDVSKVATHIFTFTTATTTEIDGYYDIIFPADFSNVIVGNINCGDVNYAATAPDTETARCTATAQVAAPDTMTVTVTNIDNPNYEDDQLFTINHYDEFGVLKERVQVRVAIIEDVLMTARVQATLTFEIDGMTDAETVNGELCTENTTATTVPFGILDPGTPQTVCQELRVSTNSDDGYSVKVWEDDEMTSGSGSNINSFDNAPDNTGSSTQPHAWVAPTHALDETNTYGHMGLTSEDQTLSWGDLDPFDAATAGKLYVGFNANDQIEVMYHDGPSDLQTPDKGLTQVAYTAEVSALQEAGDYENTLTYICTPQY